MICSCVQCRRGRRLGALFGSGGHGAVLRPAGHRRNVFSGRLDSRRIAYATFCSGSSAAGHLPSDSAAGGCLGDCGGTPTARADRSPSGPAVSPRRDEAVAGLRPRQTRSSGRRSAADRRSTGDASATCGVGRRIDPCAFVRSASLGSSAFRAHAAAVAVATGNWRGVARTAAEHECSSRFSST